MHSDYYCDIHSDKVAHEIIDGEAIIIHFNTGNYYSLEGFSAQLWQWLAAGASRSQILDAFKDLQPGQVQSLDRFFDDLVKEELVERKVADPGRPPVPSLPRQAVAFDPPKFAKYDDMHNLLLADPIHEVDEQGWPNLDKAGP